MNTFKRLFLKKTLMLLGAGALVAVSVVNVKLVLADYNKDSSVFLIVETLAYGESIGGGGNGNPSPVERLKLVTCRCMGSSTYGATYRCSTEGTREKCTATQQGSNACYQGTTNCVGTTMLCEGQSNYWIYS
ncbi:MAG: hypothetical protein LBG15_16110 [Dysgonamonadaceae bacterium]|jgi:hypothetical protein|nr:hypothetical protein [Dysgonamonadaceae bacterium]